MKNHFRKFSIIIEIDVSHVVLDSLILIFFRDNNYFDNY